VAESKTGEGFSVVANLNPRFLVWMNPTDDENCFEPKMLIGQGARKAVLDRNERKLLHPTGVVRTQRTLLAEIKYASSVLSLGIGTTSQNLF
jgi:hypothetical protein